MRLYSLAAPAVLLMALLFCSYGDPLKAAPMAVEEFHRLYNAKQFDAIYDASDSRFKKAVTKTQFIDLMNDTFTKLGKIKDSKQTNFERETVGIDNIIRMYYKVAFENSDGTEVMTFVSEGGKVYLAHYSVDSPLLH